MALPGDYHHLQSHARLHRHARIEHLAGCQRVLLRQRHHLDLLPAAGREEGLWQGVGDRCSSIVRLPTTHRFLTYSECQTTRALVLTMTHARLIAEPIVETPL